MAIGDVKRKLTAIFSADVEGYSRLMEEDELATVETLTSYKETMGKFIRQSRGRVVDSTGDNLLAEFGSVVDAVQCAVEVQQVLSAKNEALPENRRMHFRIGINSGDVIEEGDLIYGDGVNVAARVESLAEGGGISISGTAYDQLGKKLPLGYEYLGEQTVKNIEKPVRVYRVLTEAEAVGKVIGEIKPKTKQLRGIAIGAVAVLIIVAGALAIWNFYLRPPFEPASEDRMAFPLPEKPSIAVLPFVNISGDREQEYFSDGLTEEIITALSKTPKMLVIARNSTFTYKDKAVKVKQIAEELGVRYVMEGSVRKAGDQIRITAQLIDAIAGHHLWAERYDRNLKDIFAVQDEITKKILTALQVKLTEGEHARMWGRGTDNLDAYLKYVQSRAYWRRFVSKESNAQARQAAMDAIALDPKYPMAYGQLGYTHWADLIMNWSESRRRSLEQLEESCQKALALDDSIPMLHTLKANVYLMKKQFDKALEEGQRAVSGCPNCTENMVLLGHILRFMGRSEEAIEILKQAIRLNPFPSVMTYHNLAMSYAFAGMLSEALETFKKALNVEPNNLPANLGLAVTYASLGRETDARAVGDKILEINPKFSVEAFAKKLPYKNEAYRALLIDGLLKAGLPRHPPLPLPDKPSIAVLPFVNMSGDPGQEYFSDGITEEIITALSKIQKMFVIARTSSFKYRDKDIDVRTVGRELGVRYVLEGSVRKSEGHLRITAQLIDAKTGNHLWAERYDRNLKDIFALQDEITMKIINALQVKLTEGEHARLWGKGTDNLQAYLKSLQAREFYLTQTKENNVQARRTAEEAIALDPEYPPPYHVLSVTHFMDVLFRTTKSPQQSMKRAVEMIQKTIALDDSYALGHGWLGFLYTWLRKYEEGIMEAQKGVALDPNGAHGYLYLNLTLRFAGRFEEAIQAIEKAIRLNPFPPVTYFRFACGTYIGAGRYEEAIAAGKKAITVAPNDYMSHMLLAAAYSLAGQQEEARIAAEKVLRLNPKFSLVFWGKTLPYKNQADREHLIGALHKAGLPE